MIIRKHFLDSILFLYLVYFGLLEDLRFKIQILGHNQILYHLFYSDPDGDKTTYNIGISIVSAYMFYIVQVYLPEKKKTKNYVSKFSLVHRHEIFMLNQYVLACKQFFKEEGICYFHEFGCAVSGTKNAQNIEMRRGRFI